jgi:hypothetical protein
MRRREERERACKKGLGTDSEVGRRGIAAGKELLAWPVCADEYPWGVPRFCRSPDTDRMHTAACHRAGQERRAARGGWPGGHGGSYLQGRSSIALTGRLELYLLVGCDPDSGLRGAVFWRTSWTRPGADRHTISWAKVAGEARYRLPRARRSRQDLGMRPEWQAMWERPSRCRWVER